MPENVAWQIPLQAGRNLPTYGPDANQMLALAKMKEAQQTQGGYNAFAQLFRNKDNLQNGMVKPEVLAQAMGSGQIPGQVGLEVMGDQAKIQQQQAATQAAATKVRDEHRNWLVETVAEPAVVKYDEVLKATGSTEQATRAAQEIYTEGLTAAKQDGRLSPQEATALASNFDYQRARTNVLGVKGIAEQQRQDQAGWTVQEDVTTAGPSVKYRYNARTGQSTDLAGNPYTPTGMAAPKGAEATLFEGKTADGKPVTVRMGLGGGFVDAESGEPVKGVTGMHKIGTKAEENPEDAAKPTGPSELHGQEYLDKLPSSRAALIKGYVEGRVAFPGSFSLRSPYWQKMVADITQYEPGFDAVNINARAATRKDFTSGKSAQNITSFNTAIGHLGTLEKAAEALNNTNFPAWNTITNFAASHTGDPRIVQFNTAKQAVADELTRAFRGTGGNVYDIKGWEENLGAANSPEQLKGAIKQAVDLLRSRIESVGQQYRRGMGTTADVMDLLTPSAKKTLAMLPGGEDLGADKETQVASPKSTPLPGGGAGAAIPAPGKPPSATAGGTPEPKSEAEYNALPSGTVYLFNGKPMRKP